MRKTIVDSYPVDSEGRRLYSCLACGRIFHEDEEPCGIGCPTGFEDAFGLENADIEYKMVTDDRWIGEVQQEPLLRQKDWFADDDYTKIIDEDPLIGDVLFEWRTESYIAEVQMEQAQNDDDVVLGDAYVNDGYVALYWTGDGE